VRLILLLAACATTPSHPANEPASLGAWCHEVGAAMCRALADRCFDGMSGVAAHIRSLSCAGLGARTLAQLCAAPHSWP